MTNDEKDIHIELLRAAAEACEENAFMALVEARDDATGWQSSGQLKAAAECLRNRDLFKAEAGRIASIPSDETLAEEAALAAIPKPEYDAYADLTHDR